MRGFIDFTQDDNFREMEKLPKQRQKQMRGSFASLRMTMLRIGGDLPNTMLGIGGDLPDTTAGSFDKLRTGSSTARCALHSG